MLFEVYLSFPQCFHGFSSDQERPQISRSDGLSLLISNVNKCMKYDCMYFLINYPKSTLLVPSYLGSKLVYFVNHLKTLGVS